MIDTNTNKNLKLIFKKYNLNKNLNSYNEILKKEILNILINKLKIHKNNFSYSNILQLIEESENILNPIEFNYLKKLYLLEREYYNSEYIANELLEIYLNIRNSENMQKKIYNEVANIINILGESYKNTLPKEIINCFFNDSTYTDSKITNLHSISSISNDAIFILNYLNLKYWSI